MLRDPGATRQLWPAKFFEDVVKANPDANYLDVVSRNPSSLPLDLKYNKQVNRYQDLSNSYHEVLSHDLRLRKPDYTKVKEGLKTYAKDKYPHNKCYRNLIILLFQNVELNTFKKTSSDLNELLDNLDSYVIEEIVLGLPLIKV